MASVPPIPFIVFDPLLEKSYGVVLVGTFLSCVLVGVCALQVFLYYAQPRGDHLLLRALPGTMIVLEFVHQFLICAGMYKLLVVHFGDESVATIIVPELFIAAFFQGCIVVSAHVFYTYRIWKFGQRLWIVPCITLPLSATQFGITIANNALTLIHNSLQWTTNITWTVYGAHGINTGLDLFFVVAMIILLKKEGHSFVATRSMIHRLMILTINTGLITALCTLIIVITTATAPSTLVYACFNFLVSPLYCNTVLANLNSRDYVRGKKSPADTSNLELRSIRFKTLNTTAPDTRMESMTRIEGQSDFGKQSGNESTFGHAEIRGAMFDNIVRE